MKKLYTLLTMTLIALTITTGMWTGGIQVQAAEYSELFEIKFNPTGTHVKDGQLYIRLDYYPTEAAQTYSEQHIIDQDKESPNFGQWITNPALCQFIKISDTTTEEQLLEFLDQKITPEVCATIDNILVQENSIHLISPYMRDKCTLAVKKVIDSELLKEAVNDRFFTLTVSGSIFLTPEAVNPESITIGSAAVNRGTQSATATIVGKDNPSSADGTIDTWKIFANQNLANCEVATFFVVSGNNLSTRDTESIGAVTAGSEQTFAGLSTDIETDDYGGMYFSSGQIDLDSSGGAGIWYINAADHIPCTNQLFSSAANYIMSLQGTGTESGGTAPSVTTGNATVITCNSANVSANITSVGSANVTYWGIQYGIGAFTANVSDTGNHGSPFNFSLELTELTPSTEYQTRAFAENSVNMTYGSSVNFTTSASANPTVATNNATSIDYTSAQLNATISGLTCSNATDIMFEWGIATGNYTANWTDSGSWGNVSFNHTPTLSDNTTYYYRGGAALSGGTWQYGSEVSFSTLTYTACTVTTGAATSITATAATLNGNITDDGGPTCNVTWYWDTTDHGQSDNWTFSANQTGKVTGAISYSIPNTLSASTLYYTNIKAVNVAGIGWGSSVNFTTTAAPVFSSVGVTFLSSSISGKTDATITTISTVLPVIFFTGLGLWQSNSVCLMLAGASSIVMGFRWYDLDINAHGLAFSLLFWSYGIACLVIAFVNTMRHRRVLLKQ